MAKIELNGIGGWLRVFMGGLILMSAVWLWALIADLRELADLAERFGLVSWQLTLRWGLHDAAGVVIPLLVLWRMVRVRNWSSVMFALAGLWLLAFMVPALDFTSSVWLSPQVFPDALTVLLYQLVRNAWFALGASAYLRLSKRVANTYPRVNAAELIAKAFE